jgi:hypothetical protein
MFFLGTLFFVLTAVSLGNLSRHVPNRTFSTVLALLTVAAGFLWASWLLRGAGAIYAWHAAIAAAGLLIAFALWWGGPGRRAYGLVFAATSITLVLFSAVAFPAYIAAELDAASNDKPYCVIGGQGSLPLSAKDVTYLGIPKRASDPFWAAAASPLAVDFPITAYVRTGRPQLRYDYDFKFEFPPGIYDVVSFRWSERERMADPNAPTSIDRQIPCIPREGGLYAERPEGVAEYATPWGDFLVPLKYDPDHTTEGFSIDVSIEMLLDGVQGPAGEEAFAFLSFSDDPYEQNRTPIYGLETVQQNGFVVDAEGFYTLDQGHSIIRIRYAPDGRPLSHIECWREDEPQHCDHSFVAEETEAGFSTAIVTSYPIRFAARWQEIEEKLRPLMASFAVPGPVPVSSLRPRTVPECSDSGHCKALDRLP